MKKLEIQNGQGLKRWVAGFNLMVLILVMVAGSLPLAKAVSAGTVVINEIAWPGSVNSANDEWIELYNTSSATVDLSNWKLRYNGVDLYSFVSGASMAAHGYYLIERSEAATSVPADVVTSMTLVNTGASLELLDANASSIDVVNSTKATWFAGSSTTRATMERKDPLVSGDLASNWASSTGSGATASTGGAIIGTPKAVNSVAVNSVSSSQIKIDLSATTPIKGDLITATVKAENVLDLFAYGLEINYDPAILEFISANKGDFLGSANAVSTSFNSGFKDGVAGDLLVAEARTVDNKLGRSGSGDLLQIQFKVVGNAGAETEIGFVSAGTFAADSLGDLILTWMGGEITVKESTIVPVTGLQIQEGPTRYQLKLTWTASLSNPDHYRIERKDPHGEWKILAGVAGSEFIDQDEVVGGGKIIPDWNYSYRVTAVKGELISVPVEIIGKESRGIKGDNNRSDLVEGRDLEKLARAFALTDVQTDFNPLIDTTYDGRIDGSDLIDLGANFARKYQ